MGRTKKNVPKRNKYRRNNMIFVTVGTHEQQFNRLVEEIDKLIEKKIIKETVFIQYGYSDYNIKNCESKDMISFDEMDKYVKEARIIITHGGPGSIMLPFKYNKVPIVVPRQSQYGEHVDNHQVLFSKFLSEKNKIIMIEDISQLENIIINYNDLTKNICIEDNNNTEQFTKRLEMVINSIYE